jgi:hypothetical protein
VPLAVVQKVLRHSDPAITSNVYGNIGREDILGESVRPFLQLVSGGQRRGGGQARGLS